MKKLLTASLLCLLSAGSALGQMMGMSGMSDASAPTVSIPAGIRPAGQATLTMYPQFMAGDFAARNWMKTYPHKLVFSETKPAAITKEPQYKGTPTYASIHLGDDEKAPDTFIVLDTTPDKMFIYVDLNQDGDLTNDPRVTWDFGQPLKKGDIRTEYSAAFPVMANWKSGEGRYGISLRLAKDKPTGYWVPVGAPTGTLVLDSKPYIVFINDQAALGRYNLKATKKSLGVAVYIDEDGDGTWRPIGSSEAAELGEPIEIADKWYVFDCSVDGRTLTAYPTAAPVQTPIAPIAKVGDIAPDFTMYLPDGSASKLSDRKGKIVLVDMWATWCGPCLAAMPKVQAIHQKLKDNPGVEIIGLNVMDEKDAFDEWIKKNKETYTFTFGFDKGKMDSGSDTSRAYGVSAIPTTFLIGPDGKIVEVISGYTEENEAKIAAALDKLGAKVD